MHSSNHRLRDMEQHHPLLSAGSDVESGSLAAGVMVGGTHADHTAGNRTLWFIQDSCGMVCASMTWFLVLYAEFVVNFVMLLPAKNFWYSLLNGATFNALAVLALASHLRTMLSDPVSRRCASIWKCTRFVNQKRKPQNMVLHNNFLTLLVILGPWESPGSTEYRSGW